MCYPKHATFALFITAIAAASGHALDYRTWTDSRGTPSKTKLQFVELKAKNLHLRRQDDQRVIVIPLEKLSDLDQRYAESAAVASDPAKNIEITELSWSDQPASYRVSVGIDIAGARAVVQVPHEGYGANAVVTNKSPQKKSLILCIDAATIDAMSAFKEHHLSVQPDIPTLDPGESRDIIIRAVVRDTEYKKLSESQRENLKQICSKCAVVVGDR